MTTTTKKKPTKTPKTAKPKRETKAEHLERHRRATRAHVVNCNICYMHRHGIKAPGCE